MRTLSLDEQKEVFSQRREVNLAEELKLRSGWRWCVTSDLTGEEGWGSPQKTMEEAIWQALCGAPGLRLASLLVCQARRARRSDRDDGTADDDQEWVIETEGAFTLRVPGKWDPQPEAKP